MLFLILSACLPSVHHYADSYQPYSSAYVAPQHQSGFKAVSPYGYDPIQGSLDWVTLGLTSTPPARVVVVVK